jgi:hypothetical protein
MSEPQFAMKLKWDAGESQFDHDGPMSALRLKAAPGCPLSSNSRQNAAVHALKR